ncbi:MAG: GNAT family N-acetyltransferase [Actinobacteria bacterium]|nr:GNAT family N-acetyltransferase [Actinomycetota bacterium]
MHIQQFDPKTDAQRLQDCYGMFASAQVEDDPNVPPPSFAMFRSWWTHDDVHAPGQYWLASAESGTPLGCYELKLPTRENRSNGFLGLLVAAGSRRHGIGTTLLAHAGRQAEQADRALLMGGTRIGSPGAEFAASVGAKPGLQDARRILDVGPDLYARLPGLRADAEQHASGYSLRRWTGATPEDLVSGVCVLFSTMADAPHDEAYEPEVWDAARLQADEERAAARGTREYSVAAIHDETGDMAALTQVTVDPAGPPGWAHQQITAVTRAHRGHRLGMLLKVAMLEWLATAEPQIRQIVTFNAVPNQYMIAVNEQLGHRVSDYFQSYELPVGAALKLAVSA